MVLLVTAPLAWKGSRVMITLWPSHYGKDRELHAINKLPALNKAIAARPALAGYLGESVVVGIRPEHLDDAAVYPDHPADQRLRATIDVREALGAETLMHFGVDAPHVDSGDPDALDELGDESSSRCTGRFSPLTNAQVGDAIEITVNAAKFHFFDKSSHLAIRG